MRCLKVIDALLTGADRVAVEVAAGLAGDRPKCESSICCCQGCTVFLVSLSCKVAWEGVAESCVGQKKPTQV